MAMTIAENRALGTKKQRRRFGIRHKLYLAFGGIAALTIVATAIATVFFDRINGALSEVVDDRLPAVIVSLNLAAQSAQLAAAAPALAVAATEAERVERANQIRLLGETIHEALEQMRKSAGADDAAKLEAAIERLNQQITMVSINTARRLQIEQMRAGLVGKISGISNAYTAATAKLSDDTIFNIVLMLESVGQNDRSMEDTAADMKGLAEFDLAMVDGLSELTAGMNQAAAQLESAGNAPSMLALNSLRDRFKAR